MCVCVFILFFMGVCVLLERYIRHITTWYTDQRIYSTIYTHMYHVWDVVFALCWGTNFRALISLAHSQKYPYEPTHYFKPT